LILQGKKPPIPTYWGRWPTYGRLYPDLLGA
jgi:hypothetical protein